jgi:hypothetical protein
VRYNGASILWLGENIKIRGVPMMKKYFFFFCGLAVFAFMFISCGGSSGSATEEDDTELAGIESLNDIPDSVLDPREYDHTTSATLNTTSVREEAKAQFSRAGCETDRMKKNIIRNAIMPQMLLCYMKGMEVASGETAAGDGVFNYWRGDESIGEEAEGPGGVEQFKPRMAIKKDVDTLTFVMCNDTEKTMELVISTANNVYSGHVIDQWGEGFSGKLEFSADGTPDSFTAASFTQYFVENNAMWQGFGSESLEATPDYNTVYGFYNESGEQEFAGAVYAMFDLDEGTAKYRSDSGTYGAQTLEEIYDDCESFNGDCGELEADWIDGWLTTECELEGITAETPVCFGECVEGEICCPAVVAADEGCTATSGEYVESFTIDATNPLALAFAWAETSAYAETVTAQDPPDSSEEPTIEFTEASAEVDCSQSGTWASLTFVQEPDLTDCQAMEEEMNNWDTGELCEQQENSAGAGQPQ